MKKNKITNQVHFSTKAQQEVAIYKDWLNRNNPKENPKENQGAKSRCQDHKQQEGQMLDQLTFKTGKYSFHYFFELSQSHDLENVGYVKIHTRNA